MHKTITATGKVFLIDEDTSEAQQGDIRIVPPKEEDLLLSGKSSQTKYCYARAEVCLVSGGQAWCKNTMITFKGLQHWCNDGSSMTDERMVLFASFLATSKGSEVEFDEDAKGCFVQPNEEIGDHLDEVAWTIMKISDSGQVDSEKAA